MLVVLMWHSFGPVESYQYRMKRSLFPSFVNKDERPFGLRTFVSWDSLKNKLILSPFLSYICITLSHKNITEGRRKKIIRNLQHTFLRDWRQ